MTVDLKARPVTILVNNGTDDLDVSAAFDYADLSSESWDDTGIFSLSGTVRLLLIDGLGESFDCRVNMGRWKPGNIVSISVDIGGTDYPLPTKLQILRYPNRPSPQNPFIDLPVGSDFDYKRHRDAEGTPGGVTYGTPTNRTALINAILGQLGLSLGAGQTISEYPLSSAPEKKDSRPFVEFAGEVAYTAGYVLWQAANGDVMVDRLGDFDTLTPLNHYTVGTNEADFDLQGTLENGTQVIRVVGTSDDITAVTDESFVTVETVDGVTTTTTLNLDNQGSDSPSVTETVEQPAIAVLPNVNWTTPNAIITAIETVTQEFYNSVTGTLTRVEVTTRQPVAAVHGDFDWASPSQLITASIEVIEYGYNAQQVVIRRETTLRTSVVDSVGNLSTPINKKVIERWQARANNEGYVYTRSVTNREQNTSSAPTVQRGAKAEKPPETKYKPPAFSKEEKEFSSEVEFGTPEDTGFGDKPKIIRLPGGLCVSNAQCNQIATDWGAIYQGKQFSAQFVAGLASNWLTDFSPVRRVDFTLADPTTNVQTRTAYLIEALNISLTARDTAIGGLAIEIGQVALDGTGTPSPPYTQTDLMPGQRVTQSGEARVTESGQIRVTESEA